MRTPIQYGRAPYVVGEIDIDPIEMMIYLYLPVKMAGDVSIRLPERLSYLKPCLDMITTDAKKVLPDYSDHYIYVTAKSHFVGGGFSGNRPGWHADGYGSDGDLNYIWYNMNPTEFAVQEFTNIPDDDFKSMVEMDRQIDVNGIMTYHSGQLLRLDETIVHRVNPQIQTGMRTFIKVSVSRHMFDLKGNSHNYLFDYDWRMFDREEQRNMDNNKDYA